MDIVIPIYNRPEYLRKTLASLRVCLTENDYVILADDGSTDGEIRGICEGFLFSIKHKGFYSINKNQGVALNMLNALKLCKGDVITLDSDFIVKPEFLGILKNILRRQGNEDTIITGFNATSHPVIKSESNYHIKKTIGGGNLCFTQEAYQKHVRPSLTNNGWDWTMCHSIQKSGGRFLCTNPSVAQHIGFDSTIGHIRADIANDY